MEDDQASWLSASPQKDEQSYQMQQYLQAGLTVTERIAQSATSMKGKTGRKKHSTEGSGKELKKRLADLDEVIQGGGSGAT